jgi:hypothetical protein
VLGQYADADPAGYAAIANRGRILADWASCPNTIRSEAASAVGPYPCECRRCGA